MTTPLGSDDTERDYFEPDPERHDAVGWDAHPDGPCRCGHAADDHTHSDGGCSWRGCTCRWFDIDMFDDDEYEPDEILREVA